VIEKALLREGLRASTKVERPMDEAAGRELLSLMRLAGNDKDDLAWRTLLQIRKGHGVGDKRIHSIYDYAFDNGLRYYDALCAVEKDAGAVPGAAAIQHEMAAVRDLIGQLREVVGSVADATLVGAAAVPTSQGLLLDGLSNFATHVIEAQDQREAVLHHMRRTAEGSGASTFPDLLVALTSPEDTPEQEVERGKVNVLTMHQAKGLSADAVIVAGAEREPIPGKATGDRYRDECRLLYVSVTRAKHHLYVTFCNERHGQQRHSGSERGNPTRELTPFLRGALDVESGPAYVAGLAIGRPAVTIT